MFNQYPYINLNDLNLDYILKAIKEMRYEVTNFVSINAIKYADPIQWNITSQYEKNTIVIDPQTGTAYISVAPVPAGVALTRPEYWTVVFDLGSFVTRAAKNFTTRYEQDTTLTATFPTAAGEWLVWGDTLYVANVNITAGDSYVVGGNIRHITVEEVKNTIMQLIADNYDAIVAMIGDLDDLTTTAKDNLVAAINEIASGLSDEVQARQDADGDLQDNIDDEVQARQDADNALSSAIKNRPYINVRDFGAVGDGVTDDYNAFVAAYTAATEGTVIIVPQGIYNLSRNPDDHTKNIKWLYDYTTDFTGDGVKGGIDGVYNGFVSPTSNPYNRIARVNSKVDNSLSSPVAGGVCIDSYEFNANARPYLTITGTITNGSSVMTNVSDLSNIKVGDSLLAPSVLGWLDGSDRANSVRVVSIDTTNNTLTFGSTPAPRAIAGDGWVLPTPWSGTTQSATFTVRPRSWTVNMYLGVDTGTVDNFDEFNYLLNGVFNVNGGIGNAVEIDVNLLSATTGATNGILLTGIGNANAPNMGIRINRGGLQNWTTGIDINNCVYGIGITAYQPMLIRTDFYNNQTQSHMTPYYGIMFDNMLDLVATTRPLFGGEQLVDNATCILLGRSTDDNPQGAFIRCMSKDRATQLFVVGVNGNVIAQDYRIMKSVTAGTGTIAGYITIYDQSNNPVKLAVLQ